MLKLMSKKLCLVLVSAMALTAGVAMADPVVSNGDFSGFSGGYDYGSGLAPSRITAGTVSGYTNLSGWSVNGTHTYDNYEYLFAAAGNSGDATGTGSRNPGASNFTKLKGVTDSSNGGNYLAIDSASTPTGPVSSVSQSVGGFTVGNSYYVKFEQAAAQQVGYSGDSVDQWKVQLGSDTKYGDSMSVTGGTFTGWSNQEILFTATSATNTLTFTALNGPNGTPPFALLDGVSIVAAPLPSALSLSMVGMIVLAGFSMARNAKKTSQVEIVPAV